MSLKIFLFLVFFHFCFDLALVAEYWAGTSPFCSADCDTGYYQAGIDNCGDGACCWTGTKKLCRYDEGYWWGTAVFCKATCSICPEGYDCITHTNCQGGCTSCWTGTHVQCARSRAEEVEYPSYDLFGLEDCSTNTRRRRTQDNTLSPEQNEAIENGEQQLRNNHQYIYRVLRRDENVDNGINAQDPTSERTISQHVSSGCRHRSRYISCTTSPVVAARYSHYTQRWSRVGTPYLIAQIDVSAIPADTRVYNLHMREVREALIPGQTARNFAAGSREVLIQDHIPAEAVEIITFERQTRGEITTQLRTDSKDCAGCHDRYGNQNDDQDPDL